MKCLILFLFSVGVIKGFALDKSVSLLTFPDKVKKNQVEILVEAPRSGTGPLLIFFYEDDSNFGLKDCFQKWYSYWLEKGYTVAAISLPGCGDTRINKDFYGSYTMEAVNFAVDHIKEMIEVKDFGVIGFGLGSLAGSLLAVEREDVRCVVCIDGGYDFMRHLYPGDLLYEIVKQKNYNLDFQDSEGLMSRSLLYQVEHIQTPFYLVHQMHHSIILPEEASDFAMAMWKAGTECLFSVFDGSEDQQDFYINTFKATEKWVDRQMGLPLLKLELSDQEYEIEEPDEEN